MALTEARMSHLVRWDAKKGAVYVHALRLELDRETAERVGHAYGIVVVDAKARQGEALAAHLEDAFTRGAAEAVRKLSGEAPQDQLFEAAIARTNHALNRLFGEYGLEIEPERVSAAIVAIKDHDLVAATWGSPSMLLFHPLPNGTARAFDMGEDGGGSEGQFRTANARRCFGSIIAGRMGKRDRLLIASHDLRNLLEEDDLFDSMLNYEPTEATGMLSKYLAHHEDNNSMALLVLDVKEIRYLETDPSLAPGAPTKRSAPAPAGSRTAASITKLLKTAAETGETLTPSLMNGIGKTVSGLLRRKDEADEAPVAAAPAPAPAPERVAPPMPVRAIAPEPAPAPTRASADRSIPELPASLRQTPPAPVSQAEFLSAVTPARAAAPAPAPAPTPAPAPVRQPRLNSIDDFVANELSQELPPPAMRAQQPPRSKAARAAAEDKTILATIFSMVGALLLGLLKFTVKFLRGTVSLLLSLFTKEKREAKFKELRAGADNFFYGTIDRYNSLNRASKAGLVLVLISLVALKGMFIYRDIKQAEQDVVIQYENRVANIAQKIDAAEASVIYRDEARAASLLAEASTQIGELPGVTPAEIAQKEALSKRIADAQQGLRREVQMGQGSILASISTANGSALLAKMTSTSDRLWMAAMNGEVFHLPVGGGTPEKAGDVPGGGAPSVLIADGKTAYVAAADGKGAELFVGGTPDVKPVNFGNGETVPVDGEIYNGRLYVLDTAHNRISRHLEQPTSFDAAQFYLKDGTDLSGGVSIAIDGLVWVLKRDGQIVRIKQGLQESFSTGLAEPPVTSAVRLRTTANSDLFVLDANPSRILRYDKRSGAMTAQYVSEDLKGATDFSIDDKGTTAYVIKGNQVLQFAMPTP